MTTAILFLVASLGVVHGFLLGGYTLLKKPKAPADWYFGGLLLALSIRIGKSIIYYFDPTISQGVLQVGLSACIFIGPFFAFYVRAKMSSEPKGDKLPLVVTGILLSFITVVGIVFPYERYPDVWNQHVVLIIYSVWLLFFGVGIQQAWPLLRQLRKIKKFDTNQKHLLGVIAGGSFITATYQFAYHVSGFTYIWGALIFTFAFYYLAINEFLLVRKSVRLRAKKSVRTAQTVEADQKSFQKLEALMKEEALYKNPKLQLKDLASAASLSPHALSRLLNEVYPHGFSRYINEKRVTKAQQLMKHAHHLSLEGIGYEAGFNSKSSFFGTFKKMTGQTPAQYKHEQDTRGEATRVSSTL